MMSNALSASEVNILTELLIKVRDHSIDIADGLAKLVDNHPLGDGCYNEYLLNKNFESYLTYDEKDGDFYINDDWENSVAINFTKLTQDVKTVVANHKLYLDKEYGRKLDQEQMDKDKLKRVYRDTISKALAEFPELKDEIK